MNNAQSEANVIMAPAAYSSGGTSVFWFDRKGFDYCEVDVVFGTLATNGVIPSVCRITESDATVISNFTTITGASATLAAATLGGSIVKFQIDLRRRKRYLNLDLTHGTSTAAITLVMGAVAKLTRAGQGRYTAARQSITNEASTGATAVNQIVRI